MSVDRNLYDRLRRRILMFYFAAGINLVMGIWVLSAGTGKVASSTLWIIVLIFLGFAVLNFRMARTLRRQWDDHLKQQQQKSVTE
jgi:positive regulator of sigma E activity